MKAATLKVPRSGEPALEFKGCLIGEWIDPIAGEAPKRKDFRRWHAIRIYRTAAGQIVAAVAYITRCRDEPCAYYSDYFDSLEEAAAWLQKRIDPTADVVGFPPTGEQMERRKVQVKTNVAKRYQHGVSRALKDLGLTEVVA